MPTTGETCPPRPLCRVALCMGLREYLANLGIPFDPVLERVGLEADRLRNPNSFIPLEQECALLEEATEVSGRPALMLEVSGQQQLGIFGALGVLALGSSDVRSGLEVFRRYLRYSIQAVSLDLRTEKDTAFFTLQTDFPPAARSRPFWLHGVSLMCQIVRRLCGRRWAPGLVYLDHEAPRDLGPYAAYFGAPLAFAQGCNGLAFSAEVLDWPIQNSLPALSAELRTVLGDDSMRSASERAAAVMPSLLMTRSCSAETVAASLGMSERTLQRRLQSEGSSFRQVLEGLRASMAVNYMREPQFRLTDVAEMLGYAELSVFSRSFKHWYGVTPQAWRRLSSSERPAAT